MPIGMPTIWSSRILATVKYEFSTKNYTVLLKEVLGKKVLFQACSTEAI